MVRRMVLANFSRILRPPLVPSCFVAEGIAAVGVVRTEIGPFPLKQVARHNLSWLFRREIVGIK